MSSDFLCQVSARAIITQGAGKILLLHRREWLEDFWEVPGGRVKFGETLPEALSREVEEEVGLKIGHSWLVHAVMLSPAQCKLPGGGVQLFYSTTARTLEITLSSQHDKFRWAHPDSILEEPERTSSELQQALSIL